MLNILFAGLLLLSYASAYISPQTIWFMPFFGLAYPYFLLFNVLFVIFWAFRRRLFFLFSTFVILAGYSYLGRYFISPFRKSEPLVGQSDFRLMSYNVRLFDYYRWSKIPDAGNRILEFIARENPDVVCFQEFMTTNKQSFTGAHIKQMLPELTYTYIVYKSKPANRLQIGSATFSRYPIAGRGEISFDNSTNLTIYTDIVVGVDTLRVFNNHLQSIRFKKRNLDFIDTLHLRYDDEHLTEIKEISNVMRDAYHKRSAQVRKLNAEIKQSPYPVIVCGDFNDTPVSYAYRKMRGDLIDAWLQAGRGAGYTYSGRLPSFRIDYIFHSDELVSHKFTRHRVEYSDHYPVHCDFEFR